MSSASGVSLSRYIPIPKLTESTDADVLVSLELIKAYLSTLPSTQVIPAHCLDLEMLIRGPSYYPRGGYLIGTDGLSGQVMQDTRQHLENQAKVCLAWQSDLQNGTDQEKRDKDTKWRVAIAQQQWSGARVHLCEAFFWGNGPCQVPICPDRFSTSASRKRWATRKKYITEIGIDFLKCLE